jgi:hypothetical protein
MAIRRKPEDSVKDVEGVGQVDTRTGVVLDEHFEDNPEVDAKFAEDTAPVVGRIASVLSDEDRAAINTLEDLERYIQEHGVEVRDSSVVLNNGAAVISKEKLQDVPFYILGWKYAQSKRFGQHFTIVEGMVKEKGRRIHDVGDGQKFVFTDGGHGIHGGLLDLYSREGQTTIIACSGLTPSDYERKDPETGEPVLNPDGSTAMGRTWYIR